MTGREQRRESDSAAALGLAALVFLVVAGAVLVPMAIVLWRWAL